MTATSAPPKSKVSFTPELFAFLADLREHNTREWFAANKDRYESALLEPALEFVADFAPYLETISSHFRADPRPSGGSLFRIYRDTRFSKDKTPYKTNLGIHFRHERSRDTHAPGFYLHLSPGEIFLGGGIWHPDTATALRIREAIVDDSDGWRRATRAGAFAKSFTLGGDSLKRPPAGFDAGHPFVDDLKRKDFFGWTTLTEQQVTAPGFIAEYARRCQSIWPLMRFLCEALELPY
jgi:uncharacterized protein (TIGR02453 family)